MEKFFPLIKNIIRPFVFTMRPIKFELKNDIPITVSYMEKGEKKTVTFNAKEYLEKIEKLINED